MATLQQGYPTLQDLTARLAVIDQDVATQCLSAFAASTQCLGGLEKRILWEVDLGDISRLSMLYHRVWIARVRGDDE